MLVSVGDRGAINVLQKALAATVGRAPGMLRCTRCRLELFPYQPLNLETRLIPVGIVKLSEVGAVANHINLMRHI
jgi:hypothetical protein